MAPIVCKVCVKTIIYNCRFFRTHCNSVSNMACGKIKAHALPLISSKREGYDHYFGQDYKKFQEIPLTSKGWNHSKSKGDFFIIHPNSNTYADLPQKPLNDIDIDSNLLSALQLQNIFNITSFQEQCLNVIRQGENAFLSAETGSGKTIAYSLPILHSLVGDKSTQMNTPRALILTPSRELAYQIGSVVKPLAEAIDLNASVVVGGRTKQFMLNPEFKEIDILVSTPGVIGKLSTVGVFRLNEVRRTVLDEADTLLDDSFIDRMTSIINRVSQSQLILVSATMPNKFPAILEPFEPHLVHVTSPLLHRPLSNVTQKFIRVLRSGKPPHILEIAKNNKVPLLIFTNRSDTCNWLGTFFNQNGVKYARINGKMNYYDRIEEWNKFVTENVNILIATDVGSRGLDTTQIKHVVNYDFPIYAADYLHRIGRTGRLGSPEHCKVTHFISGPEEVALVKEIELAVRKNEPLTNVDGNITKLLHNKLMRKMREADMI